MGKLSSKQVEEKVAADCGGKYRGSLKSALGVKCRKRSQENHQSWFMDRKVDWLLPTTLASGKSERIFHLENYLLVDHDLHPTNQRKAVVKIISTNRLMVNQGQKQASNSDLQMFVEQAPPAQQRT